MYGQILDRLNESLLHFIRSLPSGASSSMALRSEDLTLADELFEAACRAKGILYKRIPVSTAKGHRRPDYRVDLSDCKAVIEVKQISKNDEDRRQAKALKEGRSVVYNSTPGDRLRGAIRNASGQLRRWSLRGVPTAVAIFDSTFSMSATDPYNVKTAMFGLDAVVLALPKDRTQRPHITGMKRAGKATLTPEHNTSVSAVIIIRMLPPRERKAPLLLVYHNHLARVPTKPETLRKYVDYQYVLRETDVGETSWFKL